MLLFEISWIKAYLRFVIWLFVKLMEIFCNFYVDESLYEFEQSKMSE